MPTELPRTFELSVAECPICATKLVDMGTATNCPKCASRPRTRTLAPVLDCLAPWIPNAVAAKGVLGFAMSRQERQILSTRFVELVSVSLFGTYGGSHTSGVDITDLGRYPDHAFAGIYSCLLFDYVLDQERAIREAFRVTAPGGFFLTRVAPYRLVDGDKPPERKGKIRSRGEYFNYLKSEDELPDVTVGKSWFAAALARAGYEVGVVHVGDLPDQAALLWFFGRKPHSGEQQAQAVSDSAKIADSATTKSDANPVLLAGQPIEVFRALVPFGESLADLRVDEITLNPKVSVELLEPGRAEVVVGSRSGESFYSSSDGGENLETALHIACVRWPHCSRVHSGGWQPPAAGRGPAKDLSRRCTGPTRRSDRCRHACLARGSRHRRVQHRNGDVRRVPKFESSRGRHPLSLAAATRQHRLGAGVHLGFCNEAATGRHSALPCLFNRWRGPVNLDPFLWRQRISQSHVVQSRRRRFMAGSPSRRNRSARD